MADKRVYRIIFHNRGNIYEMHARRISQGSLFAFVEIEDLIFGERSAVLVDPSEERLKAEFAGVKRVYIPIQSVVRIDEVEREGPNKILAAGEEGANVKPFPLPAQPPRGRSE